MIISGNFLLFFFASRRHKILRAKLHSRFRQIFKLPALTFSSLSLFFTQRRRPVNGKLSVDFRKIIFSSIFNESSNQTRDQNSCNDLCLIIKLKTQKLAHLSSQCLMSSILWQKNCFQRAEFHFLRGSQKSVWNFARRKMFSAKINISHITLAHNRQLSFGFHDNKDQDSRLKNYFYFHTFAITLMCSTRHTTVGRH